MLENSTYAEDVPAWTICGGTPVGDFIKTEKCWYYKTISGEVLRVNPHKHSLFMMQEWREKMSFLAMPQIVDTEADLPQNPHIGLAVIVRDSLKKDFNYTAHVFDGTKWVAKTFEQLLASVADAQESQVDETATGTRT